MTRSPWRAARVVSAALAVWGCGSPKAATDRESEASAKGAQVFEEPLSDGNSFTCATCHALSEPAADGLRRPGHPLGDATRRGTWKNGRAKTFLDAANSCVTEWMVASAWTADDPRYLALYDYLDGRASVEQAPDVHFDIVSPPSDVSGGDGRRGQTLFNRTCVVCHGTDGLGSQRGPSIADSKRDTTYIATRVRTSGSATSPVYDGLTGGVMPFWAKDRLSDDELRDLIAFVKSPATPSGVAGEGGTGGVGKAGVETAGASDSGGAGGARAGSGGGGSAAGSAPAATAGAAGSAATGCTSKNPRVGFSADLGINHGEGQVSGTVTVLDDCTLELRNFSYDGNGIDVRVYGSKNQTFKPGFVIGPDLKGRTFSKATLRVTLPADKELDELDWVSIWCVPASANFGSGPFLAPN